MYCSNYFPSSLKPQLSRQQRKRIEQSVVLEIERKFRVRPCDDPKLFRDRMLFRPED